MLRETLKTLLAAHGVAGFEQNITDTIKAIFEGNNAFSVSTDALGNLIVKKPGSGKRIMLAAHMDQIGFIVTAIDDKGFLRIMPVGGINPTLYLYRQVRFQNGVCGVIGLETDHDEFKPTFPKVFVDIGAASKAEAEAKVSIGAVCAPLASVIDMGDCVSGPAMDNRAGCAVMAEAMLQLIGSPNEIYAVFTAQEEVGLRGARTSSFTIEPDFAIALDVTPTGDTPTSIRYSVDLRKGPAVKVMDMSVICHPHVRALLNDAAKRLGLAVQQEVLHAGGTDSGAISQTKGGIPSGVVSVPCRYVHTPAETVHYKDMESAVKLLVEALRGEIA